MGCILSPDHETLHAPKPDTERFGPVGMPLMVRDYCHVCGLPLEVSASALGKKPCKCQDLLLYGRCKEPHPAIPLDLRRRGLPITVRGYCTVCAAPMEVPASRAEEKHRCCHGNSEPSAARFKYLIRDIGQKVDLSYHGFRHNGES